MGGDGSTLIALEERGTMFGINLVRLIRLLNVARRRGDLLAVAVLETMLSVRPDHARTQA